MVKVILVLLYLWKGSIVLEKNQAFEDEAACKAAGQARVEELVKDPRFDAGLFAGCVPLQAQEAQK